MGKLFKLLLEYVQLLRIFDVPETLILFRAGSEKFYFFSYKTSVKVTSKIVHWKL